MKGLIFLHPTIRIIDWKPWSINKEILKLRGLVPEKLVEKVFIDRYFGIKCKTGYGKGVAIDGKKIVYVCEPPVITTDDSDANRQSVDAGMWDGTTGEFAEVKFNPEAFHTKDIHYLRLLIKEMKEAKLHHVVYLVSMGDKNLTRMRLESIHKWADSEFVLIGREELFEMNSRGYTG